ncbi:hypothetical protein DLAC_04603 [Tieghemostelium lacteum]|uniref:Uncharacterized protein n=1 Tax=Tieghemostelium lacteum TaxID=361077 RepID=A0A151ZK67_TIELA|nr:hypothetical protein DLAC_04603 [Tieghemostelium lacteum]|eukprot:KYQ94305.1 hypothetical protein DLAC_04603 [Tieghemostelium lacteum]
MGNQSTKQQKNYTLPHYLFKYVLVVLFKNYETPLHTKIDYHQGIIIAQLNNLYLVSKSIRDLLPKDLVFRIDNNRLLYYAYLFTVKRNIPLKLYQNAKTDQLNASLLKQLKLSGIIKGNLMFNPNSNSSLPDILLRKHLKQSLEKLEKLRFDTNLWMVSPLKSKLEAYEDIPLHNLRDIVFNIYLTFPNAFDFVSFFGPQTERYQLNSFTIKTTSCVLIIPKETVQVFKSVNLKILDLKYIKCKLDDLLLLVDNNQTLWKLRLSQLEITDYPENDPTINAFLNCIKSNSKIEDLQLMNVSFPNGIIPILKNSDISIFLDGNDHVKSLVLNVKITESTTDEKSQEIENTTLQRFHIHYDTYTPNEIWNMGKGSNIRDLYILRLGNPSKPINEIYQNLQELELGNVNLGHLKYLVFPLLESPNCILKSLVLSKHTDIPQITWLTLVDLYKKSRSLTKLGITFTELPIAIVSDILKFNHPTVDHLSFEGCRFGIHILKKLQKSISKNRSIRILNLENLECSDSPNQYYEFLSSLIQRSTTNNISLESINFNNKNITIDSDIINQFIQSSNLQFLDIGNNFKFTNTIMSNLKCPYISQKITPLQMLTNTYL